MTGRWLFSIYVNVCLIHKQGQKKDKVCFLWGGNVLELLL